MRISTELSHSLRTGIAASMTAIALAVAATPVHAKTTLLEDWHNAQNFSIEFIDEKLSVEGDNIPLETLLLEIQEQTGIPINFSTNTNTNVSLNVYNESLESVIAKIADSHLIIHANSDGAKKVTEVTIISANTELNDSETGDNDIDSEFLPSGEPAPVVAAATAADKAEKKESL